MKIVLKGLPRDINEREDFDELFNLGYEILNVPQFGKPENRLPIHMVTLKNTPENKAIFNLHNLFYMAIKVERYKSNTPAQCFNYQRFGHSIIHCGFEQRCVKCTGPHKAIQCVKTSEEKPKCINYDGDHTVNFKKCPTILQAIEAKRQPRLNTQKPKNSSLDVLRIVKHFQNLLPT